MANTITGRISAIGNTVQLQSKNGGKTFFKREFLLDATTYDPYTGERSQYENIVPLEVSGEKCEELDKFSEGDVITVSFALQGREWTAQDGTVKRMASIRCYKIERRSQQAQQQLQGNNGTQRQSFPPEVDAYGNPQENNDLPF
ncbi:DUF3127 domain-containing protein [Bacteroides sp. An19]|uniref:DUF3127 domain-containing protein n=1 Tax=Bacteroides sp. An19 TaxID=1965580 RepID=UPI000B398D3F|nr:DUF3127 domain-containing protein [Bacteroides sp. An19]OUP37221.1 single-stranded DNA-binding protein [Bacteroides sp. An19]